MDGERVPASERLQWIDPLGIGFLPPEKPADDLYNSGYWLEYRRRDATEIGRALTQARVDLVARHIFPSCCVDVGIGGGAFVEAAKCRGTDINPYAVAWLDANGFSWDGKPVPALTFWDSLEHIADPTGLLAKASRFVFVSMPIYASRADAVKSKHFKPDEHLWYASALGLERLMAMHGFTLVELTSMESDLGREGIMSFVFRRA